MSNNITDWIKDELYPSLFESIDRALPEFDFNSSSIGWRSSLKLDLSSPKQPRKDKTVVTKRAPGLLLEQGGETISLVNYIMGRDKIQFIEAVKTLANIAGLQLPPSKDFDPESYQKYKDQATILESCNSYFVYCLENSPGAEDIKAYLTSRGYSSEEVKAMELGYIPSQDKLFKYLLSKGYSQTLIEEVIQIKRDTRIGSTHKITIPYRSGVSIKGFKFRTVGTTTPKYLNSSGLDKTGGFFNLSGIKGDKDIVIVEGELDSLHATVKGVNNVVALGGSSISPEQIKDAKKRGAKSFTICLDQEPGKEEETAKRVSSIIEAILGEGVNRVYIATLPDLGGGKTDPDRLIKESGVDSFREAIAGALPYYSYKLNAIFDKYGAISNSREGGLNPKEVHSFEEEVIETASRLEPIDKDTFIKAFTSDPTIKGMGITEESLSITVDRLTSSRDKEAQDKELKKLLSEATALQDKGEGSKALELLNNRVKDVKAKDKATEFNSLLIPIKEAELSLRMRNKPESLNSGYTIGGEELLLPSGAISVFCAPTSHGKTTLLINLALNVAKGYPNKETYLFSYEEDSDSILMNALNTYVSKEYPGENLSKNNRKSLKSYFATGSTEYIRENWRESFLTTKDKFFRGLIATRRLNINYTSYNSDTIIEAIRYLHKHANPGAIFIDYIQLLNLPEGKYKTYSRQEEIKEICIALKDVAVETGLPIILGAQFNREVVNQCRIHATKIGEAGDIERIANLIVGFWNSNFTPLGTEGEIEEINQKGWHRPDSLYTKILKQRGGRVGLEELLSFEGNTGVIKNNNSSSGSGYFK